MADAATFHFLDEALIRAGSPQDPVSLKLDELPAPTLAELRTPDACRFCEGTGRCAYRAAGCDHEPVERSADRATDGCRECGNEERLAELAALEEALGGVS